MFKLGVYIIIGNDVVVTTVVLVWQCWHRFVIAIFNLYSAVTEPLLR